MKFQAFLPHNSKDKPALRKIYERLQPVGSTAFFEAVSTVPGRSWVEQLPRVVNECDSIAFFHGPTGPSPYFIQELGFAVQRQGELGHETGQPGARLTMIPVLVHDADDKAII